LKCSLRWTGQNYYTANNQEKEYTRNMSKLRRRFILLHIILVISLVCHCFTQQQQQQQLVSCDESLFFSSQPEDDAPRTYHIMNNTIFWMRANINNNHNIHWTTSIPLATSTRTDSMNTNLFSIDYQGQIFTLQFLDNTTQCSITFSIAPINSTIIVGSMKSTTVPIDIDGKAAIQVQNIEANNGWNTTCSYGSLQYTYYVGDTLLSSELTNTRIWTMLPYGTHDVVLYVTDSCGSVASLSTRITTPGPFSVSVLKATVDYLNNQNLLLSSGAIAILLNVQSDLSTYSATDLTTLKAMAATILKITIADLKSIQDYSDDTSIIQVKQRLQILYLLTGLNLGSLGSDEVDALLDTLTTLVVESEMMLRSYNLAKQQIADISSNILISSVSSVQTGQELVALVNSLSKTLLSNQLVGEKEQRIRTETFSMVWKMANIELLSSTLINGRISNGNTSVILPRNLTAILENPLLSYAVTTYNRDPYVADDDNEKSSDGLMSTVLELLLRDEFGNRIELRNLPDNNNILVQLENIIATSDGDLTFICKSWDEALLEWTTDGCQVLDVDHEHVNCGCDHTGIYAAFTHSDELPPVNVPSYSIEVVMNTFYVAVCTFALVKLTIMRDKQPVKSRFIAPYLGVIGIIADSLVEGLAKNLLYLFVSEKHANLVSILHYITWLTANPLVILAMFVYLWQQIRYIAYKNLYHLMASEKLVRPNYVMQVLQILVSKALFATVTLLVFLFVELFFASLVGVSIGIPRLETTASNVQAISYAVFVIVLGICIIVTIVVDLISAIERGREGSIFARSSSSKKIVVNHSPISPSSPSRIIGMMEPIRIMGQIGANGTPTSTATPNSNNNSPTIALNYQQMQHLFPQSHSPQERTMLEQSTSATDAKHSPRVSPMSPKTPNRMVTIKEVSSPIQPPVVPLHPSPTITTEEQKKGQSSDSPDLTTLLSNHFIRHDFFLFRFESIFLFLTVLVMVGYYGIFIYTKYFKIDDASSPAVISQKILEKVFKFLEKLAFGGFIVLTVTFKTFMKAFRKWRLLTWVPIDYFSKPMRKRDKSTFNQQITDMLKCDNGFRLASFFYQQEFALENVLAWKDLEEITQKTTDTLLADYKYIHEVYVQMPGERVIPLSPHTKIVMLKVYMAEKPTVQEIEKALTMFHHDLMRNLTDTFNRMEKTQEYKLFFRMKKNAESMPIEMLPFEPV
jgi:hypothetical protein